jgi:small GTP-binding protein
MSNDLELIKQLEKEIEEEWEKKIGQKLKEKVIELKELEFEELEIGSQNGFALDKKGEVIGLNLDNLRLEFLPLTVLKFKNLKILSLFGTKIINYSILQDMSNLTTLYLGSNEIADYSFLECLRNLTSLNLSHNEITDISFLLGLENLEELDLRNNKITELPEAIIELGMEIDVDSERTSGRGIYLYGNPLEKPPIEIVRKGKRAIRAYFKSLAGQKKALNEMKVLLVGDGGSGKTSLVKRLLGQTFDKNEPQTHGININPWKIKDDKNEIKVNIWDFGGQEIMHATHQFFLSKRSLYILVLDGRRDEKTEYWLKHIQSFGGDSPVLVVINKIDQNPAFDVNRIFLQEKYKNIQEFFRVSCATGEGINDFSQQLIQELSKVELIRTTWANSWFNVKTRLEKMTEDFIDYEEYKIICKKENIMDKISQDTLVDYLNDLGVILHFKDFKLEETYVLDPEWVTTAVYKIINSKEIIKNLGLLKLNLISGILRKENIYDYYYPRDKYRYIIDLMQKFELCYSIDDETVLIPDLLAVQEPTFDFDYTSVLRFIIQYDFLPRSIMPRFIVNMHKDIKDHLQWRTGVVLEDNDFESTAVIKADNEAKRIYIYVNGGQKRDYFAAVLITLRRINQSFEKLKTKELVPMPDEPEITADYKQLIRFEKEGIEFYLPGESQKKYRVKDLLGTVGGPKIEETETLQMLRTIKMTQMQKKASKKTNSMNRK